MNGHRLAFVAFLVQAATPSPSPRPITESVEKVIDRVEAERKDPCLKAARENVPCFPVKTEEKRFDASVRESLGLPDPPDKPTPGSSAHAGGDEGLATGIDHAHGRCDRRSRSASASRCSRSCGAKNDTYYLYRVRDVHGERVLLYDHKLDASRFQGDIAFLGKFDGECEALVAYRREQRRAPSPSPPPP